MKVLCLAGSLRKESLNKKFAQAAAGILAQQPGVNAEYLDLKDYPMPVYDGDVESESGLPQAVKQLGAKIAEVDALVVSTPEYNGSIPGVLKNGLDWLSRDTPMSIRGKHVLLLSVTPSGIGGMRGLWHSRVPFAVLGAHVYPDMMGIPSADTSLFAEDGTIADDGYKDSLTNILEQFVSFVP